MLSTQVELDNLLAKQREVANEMSSLHMEISQHETSERMRGEERENQLDNCEEQVYSKMQALKAKIQKRSLMAYQTSKRMDAVNIELERSRASVGVQAATLTRRQESLLRQLDQEDRENKKQLEQLNNDLRALGGADDGTKHEDNMQLLRSKLDTLAEVAKELAQQVTDAHAKHKLVHTQSKLALTTPCRHTQTLHS